MKFTEYWILRIRKDTLQDVSWVPAWVWFLRSIFHTFSASAFQPVRWQVFLTQYPRSVAAEPPRTQERNAEVGARPAQPPACAEAVTIPPVPWSFRKKQRSSSLTQHLKWIMISTGVLWTHSIKKMQVSMLLGVKARAPRDARKGLPGMGLRSVPSLHSRRMKRQLHIL